MKFQGLFTAKVLRLSVCCSRIDRWLKRHATSHNVACGVPAKTAGFHDEMFRPTCVALPLPQPGAYFPFVSFVIRITPVAMFRPAVRRAVVQSASRASAPSRRFLSTAPPHEKSRSWKNSAVRWTLAGALIYYYNTSNAFAEEPSCERVRSQAGSFSHLT